MFEEKVYKNSYLFKQAPRTRNFHIISFTQKQHLYIKKEQLPALPPKKYIQTKCFTDRRKTKELQ